ncbi:hypothetical protein [Photobacterium damselae]|uniref:hypothetical protein n=1 Tax=Photobacterium damselae TaxID=38293 RepID=UPI001F30D522|nr:hypothetical protein [Photobacterium damselae]UKA04642.1 hypothetical protein IHC89_23775 [Photobacterium damselae subsp. damselae]
MNKFIKTILVMVAAIGYSECANAVTISNSTIEQYNQNSIYNCDAKELSTFIEQSTKPLFIPLPVPNAEQFTQEKAAQGGDPCLSLFNNLDALKDLQKVLDVIQNFQMPSMPSMDGIAIAAKLLAKKMVAMATQSVCNALTKQAAMAVINTAMHNKIGMSLDEMKSFDPKEYAKGLALDAAENKLSEHGIDNKWLYGSNKDDYINMIHDEAKDRANDMLKEKSQEVTKNLADKMF